MTKEEIIEAIADDWTMPFIQPEQLAGIVDFVIKNYVPSVPGLDAAAENYAHSLGYDEEKEKAEIAGAKEDFIAGAEWDRAKMTGKAVEGRYMKTIDGKCYVVSSVFSPDGFVQAGGKVKLIIIKDDGGKV